MNMKKHGNGYLDHTTTTVSGNMPRIYHVNRKGHFRPIWTKNPKTGDEIFEYVDVGEDIVKLKEVIIIE